MVFFSSSYCSSSFLVVNYSAFLVVTTVFLKASSRRNPEEQRHSVMPKIPNMQFNAVLTRRDTMYVAALDLKDTNSSSMQTDNGGAPFLKVQPATAARGNRTAPCLATFGCLAQRRPHCPSQAATCALRLPISGSLRPLDSPPGCLPAQSPTHAGRSAPLAVITGGAPLAVVTVARHPPGSSAGLRSQCAASLPQPPGPLPWPEPLLRGPWVPLWQTQPP